VSICDVPAVTLTAPPETEVEQTTQLHLPDAWHWPDHDPDLPTQEVIAQAQAALHHHDEPTLPILRSVLSELQRLTTDTRAS
jgi:hypothetical protein